MSISKRWITCALAAALAATPALAADRKSQVDQPADTRTERDAHRDTTKAMRPHPGGLVEANWIIGAHLYDADGKDLGRIKEVWVDPKTGQTKEVIVSIGATMGLGGKDKVLSWSDLQIAWKDQKLHVSADPKALRDAYQTKMDRDDRGPAASPPTATQK
jgi:sporulation protein YlmC with PRC-barrel domain